MDKHLICLTLIAITCAPLQAADREHEQLMADLRMLQEQTSQLHQLIGGLEGVIMLLDMQISKKRLGHQSKKNES